MKDPVTSKELTADCYRRLAALRPRFLGDILRADKKDLKTPMRFGVWVFTTHNQVFLALLELEGLVGSFASNDWMNSVLIESGRFIKKHPLGYAEFKE